MYGGTDSKDLRGAVQGTEQIQPCSVAPGEHVRLPFQQPKDRV